ncbi:conserved hypothetical protein [Vibrio nigripulchritudo SO65]|uniref:hypothetical protein n=1 Tax=Vibrio nigripulchritudo TaxID=28173 RepID=UPI0003B1F386|nr:hypothetical protein [Vibrio nigripulchritudo]CCN34770.1 conserved hypothetical protein [Vibrio nigripulchritudo AM115]CCN43747.1 conserved hypothetical protein [Vibrio nigripulchritudo FTn2]CCN65215.1 conserved hypothetical protein [Vibrio nigripulchritudo POn4]CCN74911.1 conserved hypothetical protein [Vibrio nigripulchritudo SO65]
MDKISKMVFSICSVMAVGFISSSVNAGTVNAGTVLNKTHSANVHNVVGRFQQTRNSSGYVTYTGGKILGNTNNKFTVNVGPHNTKIGTVLGNTNLSFNPQELDCVRGLHLALTVNASTPISISPTCNALLKADIKRTFSHTIASPEVPIPEVPIDPVGVFKLGVKIGAVLKTGADFAAGLEIGGFDKPNTPIEINGQRRPDFVYASVRPFVAGDATAKGYAMLNLGVKTVEKGVKGNINLINVGTKAHAEAGVTYKEGSSSDFQYYTRLKWDASASGGNGSIGLYCQVKLFGIWNILNAETSLISWSPIWEFNHTIYDKKTYI